MRLVFVGVVMSMVASVSVFVSVFVSVLVAVAVAVAGELEDEEAEAGEDEYCSDDCVLSTLDRGAELKTEGDDDPPEHQ